VQARPHALGARLRRWRLPISIAAVVMLSVSVVTLMREEGADRFEEGLPPTMVEPTAPTAPPDDAKFKTKESADSLGRAQVPASQALPAPAAGPASPSADEARRLDAPASGRKPAELPAESRQRDAGAANEPASSAPERRPAPSTKGALVETEEDSAGKRALKKSERSLRDSRVDALVQDLMGASPETWLEKIEWLRREGRDEEADDLVVEFRRRFPEHPLPIQERARGN
jgi:hypothetical protein